MPFAVTFDQPPVSEITWTAVPLASCVIMDALVDGAWRMFKAEPAWTFTYFVTAGVCCGDVPLPEDPVFDALLPAELVFWPVDVPFVVVVPDAGLPPDVVPVVWPAVVPPVLDAPDVWPTEVPVFTVPFAVLPVVPVFDVPLVTLPALPPVLDVPVFETPPELVPVLPPGDALPDGFVVDRDFELT